MEAIERAHNDEKTEEEEKRAKVKEEQEAPQNIRVPGVFGVGAAQEVARNCNALKKLKHFVPKDDIDLLLSMVNEYFRDSEYHGTAGVKTVYNEDQLIVGQYICVSFETDFETNACVNGEMLRRLSFD